MVYNFRSKQIAVCIIFLKSEWCLMICIHTKNTHPMIHSEYPSACVFGSSKHPSYTTINREHLLHWLANVEKIKVSISISPYLNHQGWPPSPSLKTCPALVTLGEWQVSRWFYPLWSLSQFFGLTCCQIGP